MHTKLPFTLAQVQEWKKEYPTPFILYDAAGITAAVRQLQQAFAWNRGYREYFAVKATPTPAVLRLLSTLGCGADCASVPEIILAQASGLTGRKIVFTSNQTLPQEYAEAVLSGAIVNLDDITQIDRLEQAAGIPETVCCRYNPGKFSGEGKFIGTAYESKFGMTPAQLLQAMAILRDKGVKHFGIHAMLAGNTLEPDYYPRLAQELFGTAVTVRQQLGIAVEFVDLAGGIGIPYRPEEKPVDILAVGEGVRQVYEKMLTPLGLTPAIYTELGRFVTGPYGYLVTRVIGEKHTHKEYVGVDATAACLLRPAMYGAYHHITVLGKEDTPCEKVVDVVGSLCENNDKFAVDRLLPRVQPGDILVIQDAGAHGHSMGYNYNGKLRCAELMLQEGKVRLIRRAQTPEDYFSTLDIDEQFMAARKDKR